MNEFRKALRIVVIDDDLEILRFLREILGQGLGAEVISLADSSSLFDRLDGSESVIVLDVDCGGQDGRVWARRIRESGFTSPIVFITGRWDGVDAALLAELSPASVVTKPFGIVELSAALAGHGFAHLTRMRPAVAESRVFRKDE